MATPLILQILTKSDPKGIDDVVKKMNAMQQEAKKSAAALGGISSILRQIGAVGISSLAALPLAKFTQSAVQAEENMARFSQQLALTGETVQSIDLAGLTKRVAGLGISYGEVVASLKLATNYFGTTAAAAEKMDTAIAISRTTGVSLTTAFMQLGQVSQGFTGIARRFGVSLHQDIKNPGERSKAVLFDITKKFEGMVKPSGTARGELDKMKASFSAMTIAIGKDFTPVVKGFAQVINILPDGLKEMAVRVTVVTGAIAGLGTAAAAAWPLIAALGTAVLGTFGAPFLITIALATAALSAFGKLSAGIADAHVKKQTDRLAVEEELNRVAVARNRAMLEEKNATTNLDEKVKILEKDYIALSNAANEAYKNRDIDKGADLDYEAAKAKARLSQAKGLQEILLELELGTADDLAAASREAELGKTAVRKEELQKQLKALEQTVAAEGVYKKQAAKIFQAELKAILEEEVTIQKDIQNKIELIKIDGMKDGLDKQLALIKQNAQYEMDTLKGTYAESAELKAALIKKQAQNEAKVREEYAKKDLEIQNTINRQVQLVKLNGMQDGLKKELALAKASAAYERDSLTEEYAKSLELRQAMAQKSAQEIADIRIRYAQAERDKELDLALLSAEERAKYEADYQKAAYILQGQNIKDIASMTDAEKELLKSRGGSVALAERKAKLDESENKRIKNRADLQARMSLKEQQAVAATEKGITDVTASVGVQKDYLAKVEAPVQVDIKITPSADDLAATVSNKVRQEVTRAFNEMNTNLSKRLQGAGT